MPHSEILLGKDVRLAKLSVDHALLKAKSHAKKGEFQLAQKLYEDVLQAFPENKRAQQGLAALSKPKPPKATKSPPKETFDQLIKLYNQGQMAAVAEQAQALARQYPNALNIWSILGAAAAQTGRTDQAINAFKTVIAIKPDYAEAHYNMGIALKDQGKLEEAKEAYRKALSLKPDFAELHNNMGVVLHHQGKLKEAIEAYAQALSLKPEYAEPYNNIGNALKDQGKIEEATKFYKKALSLKPDYVEAHYNMGITLKDQGKLEEAKDACRKALSLKPDYAEASHILSALTGETTNSAPREYVENLFDGYAHQFDQSLVEKLSYDIPQVITQLAVEKHGSGSLGSILDLGCGTGLTGEKIRPYCIKLEGVDLSRKMLEIAKSKNVYDELDHVDIVGHLSNAMLDFDYFIATDVFIYVGDLSEVFRLIKVRNKKPGKLIFSTEHTNEKGFHLEKSGRFSHSKSYVEQLCKEFKFSISHFSETNLRKENGVSLIGGLYFLDF